MTTNEAYTAGLVDGPTVTIRPLLATDTELEREFILRLSPQSRRFRFLATIASPSDQLLRRLTTVGPGTAAFVALARESGRDVEVGVARLGVTEPGRAEFAIAVSDAWQRKGLGTLLARRVIDAARAMGVQSLFSVDAADNAAMREWAMGMGFVCAENPDDATEVIHTLSLATAQSA